MFKNIILITIENYNREYKGKDILGKELAKKGFLVLLGHKSTIRAIAKLFKLKNCIFIDKGNRQGSTNRLERIKRNGLYIFTFDEEALMQTDFNNYLKRNHPKETTRLINGIFCWGDNHKNLLIEAGFSTSQILKTGNPRFDPYINNGREGKKNTNANTNKSILICSRFASANPNKKIVSSLDKRDSTESYIKDCLIVLGHLLKLPKLIRDNGINTKILIRPHPSESLQKWKDSIKGLSNIVVECKGPIKELFSSTDFLIHNRCTTAIEAFLSNVPVISYEPINLESPPHPNKGLLNAFSHYTCTSSEQVIKQLKAKNEEVLNFAVSSIANYYLYKTDERSSKEISSYISTNFNNINNKEKILSLFKISISIPLIKVYHSYKKFMNRITNFQDYQYKKQKEGLPDKRKLISINQLFFMLRVFGNINIYIPKS